MANHRYIPKPVFDTLDEIIEQYKILSTEENPRHYIRQWLNHCLASESTLFPAYASLDYQWSLNFLHSYRGSPDTFAAYRRDIERLLQWSWFVRQQSILKHKRADIEAFVEFCIKPYKSWIGLKTVARFKAVEGKKIPNPDWRPFAVSLSKKENKMNREANKADHQLSQKALKVMFGIMSSFYSFALQAEVAHINPVLLIRQKSKFIRYDTHTDTIRRLSEQQWHTVIGLAKEQTLMDVTYERTVFILSCLFSMYLRISELVANDRWSPTMGDFTQDSDGYWWFQTVGKGNKERRIAVSDSMLEALKRYRTEFLSLPPYPTLNEQCPLISHVKNINKPITSTRPIRRLVQSCFDMAADYLDANGDSKEAESLRIATVHWLRHTGISEDVKTRPREHVRDDAGHSSSAITDRYIDVELKARALSAKNKLIETTED